MAKRLRDSERWNKKSFRKLTFEQKGILQYLEDVCSVSGIWSGDFELASMHLGIELTEERLVDVLGELVWQIGPEAWFVSTFFHEQYGEAKDTFNAKVKAIRDLQALGLMDEKLNIIRPSSNTPPTVPPPSPKSPSKVGCGGVELKEGGAGETNQPQPPPSNSEPVAFGPVDLAVLWNTRIGQVRSLDGSSRPMPTVALEHFTPDDERYQAAQALLAKHPSREYWADVIDRVARSAFCRGRGSKSGWLANFEFLVKTKTHVGVMEGEYGCTPPPRLVAVTPSEPRTPDDEGPAMTAEERAAAIAELAKKCTKAGQFGRVPNTEVQQA